MATQVSSASRGREARSSAHSLRAWTSAPTGRKIVPALSIAGGCVRGAPALYVNTIEPSAESSATSAPPSVTAKICAHSGAIESDA